MRTGPCPPYTRPVGILRGRNTSVAVGSARWWRNALTDIGFRLAGLALVVVALVSDRAHGGYFWFGLVVAVVMCFLLVFPVLACVMVLRKPGWPNTDSGAINSDQA